MGDAAYKLRHKEQGLCRSCSDPSVSQGHCLKHYYSKLISDRKYYYNHYEQRNKARNDRAERLRLENKCMSCAMPLTEDNRVGIRCVNCYEVREYGAGRAR